MVREIKFRGRRTDNGEWVYGWLSPFDGATKEGQGNRFCITNGMWAKDIHEIDPDTVGQYTGLKDKNGREVYEGDILKDTLGWVYEVRWDNDGGRFLGHHSKPRGDTYICCVGREPKSTIIGNIFENPELLEVRYG